MQSKTPFFPIWIAPLSVLGEKNELVHPTTFLFIILVKTITDTTIQYIKSEKVNLLFSGLPIISLRWGWLEDIRLLLIVLNAFGNIYINLRIEVSNIDEVSNGELRLFKEMVKLRTQKSCGSCIQSTYFLPYYI